MSAGLNFQYLSSLSSRASSRSFCSSAETCSMHLTITTPVGGQLGLELVDLRRSGCSIVAGVGQLVHPDDQDVLVVGAVEDADVARLRQGVADPPQEVVLALLGGRRLEAGDLHALRVDQADRVAQHAALARGVHALEHQQDAALGPGACARPRAAPAGRTARRRARTARPCPSSCRRRSRASSSVGIAVEVDRTGRKPVEVGAGSSCRPHHVGCRCSSTRPPPSSSRTTANASPAG